MTEAPAPAPVPESAQGQARARRAKAGDVGAMVDFLNRVRKEGPHLERAELMRSFADKGFMLAELDGRLVAAAAWHVENLVACVEELYISPPALRPSVGPLVLAAIEAAANELMAEAALLFVAPKTPKKTQDLYAGLGYRPADLGDMPRAWREAAEALLQPDEKLLLKQLREQRVTRPI